MAGFSLSLPLQVVGANPVVTTTPLIATPTLQHLTPAQEQEYYNRLLFQPDTGTITTINVIARLVSFVPNAAPGFLVAAVPIDAIRNEVFNPQMPQSTLLSTANTILRSQNLAELPPAADLQTIRDTLVLLWYMRVQSQLIVDSTVGHPLEIISLSAFVRESEATLRAHSARLPRAIPTHPIRFSLTQIQRNNVGAIADALGINRTDLLNYLRSPSSALHLESGHLVFTPLAGLLDVNAMNLANAILANATTAQQPDFSIRVLAGAFGEYLSHWANPFDILAYSPLARQAILRVAQAQVQIQTDQEDAFLRAVLISRAFHNPRSLLAIELIGRTWTLERRTLIERIGRNLSFANNVFDISREQMTHALDVGRSFGELLERAFAPIVAPPTRSPALPTITPRTPSRFLSSPFSGELNEYVTQIAALENSPDCNSPLSPESYRSLRALASHIRDRINERTPDLHEGHQDEYVSEFNRRIDLFLHRISFLNDAYAIEHGLSDLEGHLSTFGPARIHSLLDAYDFAIANRLVGQVGVPNSSQIIANLRSHIGRIRSTHPEDTPASRALDLADAQRFWTDAINGYFDTARHALSGASNTPANRERMGRWLRHLFYGPSDANTTSIVDSITHDARLDDASRVRLNRLITDSLARELVVAAAPASVTVSVASAPVAQAPSIRPSAPALGAPLPVPTPSPAAPTATAVFRPSTGDPISTLTAGFERNAYRAIIEGNPSELLNLLRANPNARLPAIMEAVFNHSYDHSEILGVLDDATHDAITDDSTYPATPALRIRRIQDYISGLASTVSSGDLSDLWVRLSHPRTYSLASDGQANIETLMALAVLLWRSNSGNSSVPAGSWAASRPITPPTPLARTQPAASATQAHLTGSAAAALATVELGEISGIRTLITTPSTLSADDLRHLIPHLYAHYSTMPDFQRYLATRTSRPSTNPTPQEQAGILSDYASVPRTTSQFGNNYLEDLNLIHQVLTPESASVLSSTPSTDLVVALAVLNWRSANGNWFDRSRAWMPAALMPMIAANAGTRRRAPENASAAASAPLMMPMDHPANSVFSPASTGNVRAIALSRSLSPDQMFAVVNNLHLYYANPANVDPISSAYRTFLQSNDTVVMIYRNQQTPQAREALLTAFIAHARLHGSSRDFRVLEQQYLNSIQPANRSADLLAHLVMLRWRANNPSLTEHAPDAFLSEIRDAENLVREAATPYRPSGADTTSAPLAGISAPLLGALRHMIVGNYQELLSASNLLNDPANYESLIGQAWMYFTNETGSLQIHEISRSSAANDPIGILLRGTGESSQSNPVIRQGVLAAHAIGTPTTVESRCAILTDLIREAMHIQTTGENGIYGFNPEDIRQFLRAITDHSTTFLDEGASGVGSTAQILAVLSFMEWRRQHRTLSHIPALDAIRGALSVPSNSLVDRDADLVNSTYPWADRYPLYGLFTTINPSSGPSAPPVPRDAHPAQGMPANHLGQIIYGTGLDSMHPLTFVVPVYSAPPEIPLNTPIGGIVRSSPVFSIIPNANYNVDMYCQFAFVYAGETPPAGYPTTHTDLAEAIARNARAYPSYIARFRAYFSPQSNPQAPLTPEEQAIAAVLRRVSYSALGSNSRIRDAVLHPISLAQVSGPQNQHFTFAIARRSGTFADPNIISVSVDGLPAGSVRAPTGLSAFPVTVNRVTSYYRLQFSISGTSGQASRSSIVLSINEAVLTDMLQSNNLRRNIDSRVNLDSVVSQYVSGSPLLHAIIR